MAKHKAATEITIVQEERSSFAEFVDRYKWHALGLLAVVAAGIIYLQRSGEAEVNAVRADWEELFTARAEAGDDFAASLATASRAIKDPAISSWVKVFQTAVEVGDRDFSDATSTLSSAREHASPLLTKLTFPVGPEGAEVALLDHMASRIEAESKFHKEAQIYSNPELPAEHPKIEFNTSAGKIVLGLYTDLAPRHANNMVKLASDGFYDGTLFHRIIQGQVMQGGDPNTKEGEPETWGLGGPGYKLPEEKSNLKHVEGAVAAAKTPGATESSGSQFYITPRPKHDFDGQYVVFGVVLEGLDLVKAAADAETEEGNAERPLEPIKVITATVL